MSTPFAHQVECLARFGRKRIYALNAEMGTGKSYIIMKDFAALWKAREVDSVLIFAPNGVHTNWVNTELPKHLPEEIEEDWIAREWRSDGKAAHVRAFEEIYLPDRRLRIAAFPWEAIQHKRPFDAAAKFAAGAKSLIIVADESHNIKNPNSTRTRNLFKLRSWAAYRRTMTGTPITEGPYDAFAQYGFLDPRILGTSYSAHKAEYAEMLPKTNWLVMQVAAKSRPHLAPFLQIEARNADGTKRYKNLDKLKAILDPYTFRVLKKDCLDLPDKIYKTAFFDLTASQERAYRMAREEYRLLLEGEPTPIAKLTAVMKLAQITSGYYLHPDREEPVRIEGGNPKLDLLVDRVRAIVEQGSKVIIWARFHVQIEDIVNALRGVEGTGVVQYHGKCSTEEREHAKNSFQEDPGVNVFIGQQAAGGSGITLVAASYVIYFSNTFRLIDRLQSEDRAHRIGQTLDVTYIDLLARSTIDEIIVKMLRGKKNVADVITGDGLLGYI